MPLMTERELQQRGQDLAPDEARMNEHAQAVHLVFLALHRQDGSDGTVVNRVFKGGSLGKKTSLYSSDADMIVFVRNLQHPERLPPHGTADLLMRFEVLLTSEVPELTILRRTSHVMTMRYGATEIDLLVARDFCTAVPAPTCGIQACEALSFIKDLPSLEQIRYSVCFTELSVEFIRQQPPHVNKFIRLVKWSVTSNPASLRLGQSAHGSDLNMKAHAKGQGISNYAIELIATKAVQAVDARLQTRGTMTAYFQCFHMMVSNCAALKVYFPPKDRECWPEPVEELTQTGSPFETFYTNRAMAARSSPVVVDPANLTNNVAARITSLGWSMLRKAADPKFALQEVSAKLLRLPILTRCCSADADSQQPVLSVQLVHVKVLLNSDRALCCSCCLSTQSCL
jgi:2'-5'-oligoadenylate synthetase 1, domain 2, C-terminus